MKIVITGHTQGIGLACNQLLGQSHEIIGVSRSNGFDINDPDTIVEIGKDADVFINNAYSEFAQVKLLEKFHFAWKDTDKVIINIGSAITRYPRIEADKNNEPWPYRDHKLALEQRFMQLRRSQCRLHLINPAATDTQMTQHLDCLKLDPIKVAKMIEFVIANPEITEITLHAK